MRSDHNSVKTVRPPAVAGAFYPRDPQELRSMVEGFLADGTAAPVPAPPPKAYILPHAGFVYSGPIAGRGYSGLSVEKGKVQRIVLLGPAHRVPVRGLALPSVDCFATPLGEVPLDREAIRSIMPLSQVTVMDAAHADEHSLEVHLPFLQCLLGEFSLVPLVVGDASAEEVGEVLQILWGGDETRIIISSDLSHFHDYRTATKLDTATAAEICSLKPVTPEQACGAHPIGGLLRVARQRGMETRLLDLRNSGDTSGPRNRVVGYGAFSFAEPNAAA